MANPFLQNFNQLPDEIPVFPLAGTCLLPLVPLHLNIFEPRYLNMIQDSLGAHHIIGMVQPRSDGDDPELPALYKVGCAGRITSYSETDDGRILAGLTGLCRFDISAELPMVKGYRMVAPDWSAYSKDTRRDLNMEIDAEALIDAANRFLTAMGMKLETGALVKMTPTQLINFLAVYLPFEPAEKQALVESRELSARLELIQSLCEMAAGSDGASSAPSPH